MPKHEADNSYRLLVHKLNKFGLPTTRRCATNENRTCACQGNFLQKLKQIPHRIIINAVFVIWFDVGRFGSRIERSIIFVRVFVVYVLQWLQICSIENSAKVSVVGEKRRGWDRRAHEFAGHNVESFVQKDRSKGLWKSMQIRDRGARLSTWF